MIAKYPVEKRSFRILDQRQKIRNVGDAPKTSNAVFYEGNRLDKSDKVIGIETGGECKYSLPLRIGQANNEIRVPDPRIGLQFLKGISPAYVDHVFEEVIDIQTAKLGRHDVNNLGGQTRDLQLLPAWALLRDAQVGLAGVFMSSSIS